MQMMYQIALLVFAAVFFGTMAVYLIVRSKLAPQSRAVTRRLDDIFAGNILEDALPFHLLKNEQLSKIRALDRLLRKLTLTPQIQLLIEQAGLKMNVGTFVLSTLVGATGLFLVTHTLTGRVVLALPAAVLGGLLPYWYVTAKRRQRIHEFEADLPDALDIIANGLRSGFSFESAMRMCSEEMPDPLGGEFAIAFEEQNLGANLSQCLANMRRRVPTPDLDLFIIVLLIQKKTGGQLAEVLRGTAETIRQRFRFNREVRTKTSHSRLSGMVLVVLPLALIGIMMLLNPDYIMILVKTEAGNYMLGAAVLLQVIGLLVIRKIVNIRM